MRSVASLVVACSLFASAAASASACASSDGAASTAMDSGPDAQDAPAADASPDGDADVVDAIPQCALPGSYGSSACNDCMKARCCAVVTACASDPVCKAAQTCVLGCALKPDAGGCVRDCLAVDPSAPAKWKVVEDCYFGDDPAGCLHACT